MGIFLKQNVLEPVDGVVTLFSPLTLSVLGVLCLAKYKWCIIACSLSLSFCKWISNWETTCIWTRAWAVVLSSKQCSAFKCLKVAHRWMLGVCQKKWWKILYLMNIGISSRTISHPGHLHTPWSKSGCPDFSSLRSSKLFWLPLTISILLSSSLRLRTIEFNRFAYLSGLLVLNVLL